MAKDSAIQWTDATWNPWYGCTKVSPGCKHCYMFRWAERTGRTATEVTRSKTTFRAPLTPKWAEPQRIFTCSLSDFFHEGADEWRPEAWDIIRQTPQHMFFILTKRPENILNRLPPGWGKGWQNVTLGISAERASILEERVSYLKHAPAAHKFLSLEPLLESVADALRNFLVLPVDWIVLGGESGGPSEARRMKEEWAREVIQLTQSEWYGHPVPVFLKQMGSYWARGHSSKFTKGDKMEEWPEDLQVREQPFMKCMAYRAGGNEAGG